MFVDDISPTSCERGPDRVARSRQAFTATSAQNHGHLGTFHGHHIFRYGHFTATFEAEIHLKAQNIFSLPLILLSTKLKEDGRWFFDVI